MNAEWGTARIEEIAEKVAMGPFGSSIKVETFTTEGVPIIIGQHLHDFRVDDSQGFNYITSEHADRLGNANAQRGDIVFTHRGNIGTVAYIPGNSRFDRYVVSQSQFLLRCDSTKAIPEFVTAYFKTRAGQHQLLANSSQVGVPSIAQPVSYLRTVEIPLPPLSEQRRIADTLGALDDKIELNRRMTETLEQMARALYKSWFVDFDPVRAKMDGQEPFMAPQLWDLFPDRLVDSDLGEIPAGWEVKTLDEIADYRNGLALQRFRPEEGEERLPAVKIAQLRTGKADGNEWAKASITADCIIDDGDVVFSWSGSLLVKVWCGGRAALNQHLFKVTSRQYPKWFFRHCTESHLPAFQAIAAGKTTTMGHIKREHLKEAKCAVPSGALLTMVDGILGGLFSRVVAANVESRDLSILRDNLLPKLLSGGLRLSDLRKSHC